MNYAEVVSHFIHAGMPGRQVDAMLDTLPLTVVPADKAVAQIAGRMRATTAETGLSLGDRFCLALAQRDGLPAWTSDQNWRRIADAVEVKVVAIRLGGRAGPHRWPHGCRFVSVLTASAGSDKTAAAEHREYASKALEFRNSLLRHRC